MEITIQQAESRIRQELESSEEYRTKWMSELCTAILMNMPLTVVCKEGYPQEMGTILDHKDTRIMARQVASGWITKFVKGDTWEADVWKREILLYKPTKTIRKLKWWEFWKR
jgi:hypothetical protein